MEKLNQSVTGSNHLEYNQSNKVDNIFNEIDAHLDYLGVGVDGLLSSMNEQNTKLTTHVTENTTVERLTTKKEEYELLKERAKKYLGVELETEEEIDEFYLSAKEKVVKKVIEFVGINYPEDSKKNGFDSEWLERLLTQKD